MTATAQPPSDATSADRLRQVVVLAGALVAVAAAAVGSGAFGGQPIQDAAGGALSATATPVAPDSPAFSIWSAIYAGLLAFAVLQALPGRGADPRLRATAWWVLASMLLNAAWIGVVQADRLRLSLVVIVALLLVLGVLVLRLVELRPVGAARTLVLDGTVGLYTGWLSVATLANLAAVLAAGGAAELAPGAVAWPMTMVAVAAAAAVAWTTFAARRRVLATAMGLALAWGLGWIAVGRFRGPLESPVVAWAAVAAALVALSAAAVVALRRSR